MMQRCIFFALGASFAALGGFWAQDDATMHVHDDATEHAHDTLEPAPTAAECRAAEFAKANYVEGSHG